MTRAAEASTPAVAHYPVCSVRSPRDRKTPISVHSLFLAMERSSKQTLVFTSEDRTIYFLFSAWQKNLRILLPFRDTQNSRGWKGGGAMESGLGGDPCNCNSHECRGLLHLVCQCSLVWRRGSSIIPWISVLASKKSVCPLQTCFPHMIVCFVE